MLSRRRCHGFTLVEVLVALLILAVLSGMAWRGIDGMSKARDGSQAGIDRSLRLNTVVAQWEADLGALGADPRVTRCDDLLVALRQHDPVTDDSFLWFAGSTDQARLARQHLLQSGRAKKSFTVAAYWG